MRKVPASEVRSLKGLKNIAWLTARQLNRLADALTTSRVQKRGVIFDDNCSPETAYILLSGVARGRYLNFSAGQADCEFK